MVTISGQKGRIILCHDEEKTFAKERMEDGRGGSGKRHRFPEKEAIYRFMGKPIKRQGKR